MTGSTLLHYQVQERLGAGGMAVVYKAFDTKLKRSVALKFLPPAAASDAGFRERLVREAMMASSLDHPNICTIFEINEAKGQLFLAMAYYAGRTLKEILAQEPLPAERAVDYASQMCAGLEKAHAHGVIHRDIKPANLIVTPEGILKIVDFGLARTQDGNTLTQTGNVMGTVPYMAPEQLSGGAVDHRTDLWASGIVLYEMLAGVRPFAAKKGETIPWGILTEEPPPFTAPPGTIRPALAAIVMRALRKNPDERYQSAAQMLADLRGLSAPTAGYSLSTNMAPPRATHAIAVLPFDNLSSDPDNEYFSDGLTEDLISALGQIDDLRVVSRSSVFEFKGKAQDVRKIGQLLKVNSVIEGSVRKSANRLRIAVRLTNAADGYQVWAERYDRHVSDVFALQDEMADTIVDALKLTLGGGERAGAERHPGNVDAYQCYLKGRFHWNKKTPEGLAQAYSYFTQALSHDSEYALAYCGLADYHVLLAGLWLAPPAEAWPKAKSAALRAVELSPQLAEARVSLGRVRFFYDWDWEGARREYETALDLRPRLVEARIGYAYYFMARNQLERALAQIRIALNEDPLSADVAATEAMILTYMGEHDRAIERCRDALEREPTFVELYYTLGLAYQQNRQMEQALQAFEQGRAVSGNNPLLVGWLGACCVAAGQRDRALALLAELNVAARTRPVAPLALVVLYAALGDTERAFEWLTRAADERDALLCYLRVVPSYESLRSDARYEALLQRMRLSGASARSGQPLA